MWIHISKIAKTTIFSTQTDVETFHKLFFRKTIHNYCRKHRKFTKFVILHNITQTSEKLSPIVSKIGIFSSATSIVLHTKRKLLTRKLSKQQLTAFTSIVKRYMAKCYKHAPISSKRTIVVTGVSKSTNIHAQNTIQINFANIGITI